MKTLLMILAFGFALHGAEAASASEGLKTLQGNVCRAVGLREDLPIGSVEFNNSALKRFSEIGPRDKMVASMMNGSKVAGVFLRIFYDDSYLSFQWAGQDSGDGKHGGYVYYATIKIRLNERDELRSLTSLLEKEASPPPDLAPFEPGK